MEDISKPYGAIKSLDDVSLDLARRRGPGPRRRQRRRQVDAEQDAVRRGRSGHRHASCSTAQPVRFASPADARAQRVEMVYQDLSLCDTVDVAGNLFLGREPRRRVLGIPFMDKRRMHAEAAAMLASLGIACRAPAQGRKSVGWPAPEHRDRTRGLL